MASHAHQHSDPTFYRSPGEAIAAPPERLAYVVGFDRAARRPDALHVVDVDADSATFGTVLGRSELPNLGDELHHSGWNACSSALCHTGHEHHGDVQRRYLLAPGLRSSRLHIFDTQPDPHHPELVKVIEADELANQAGYSRPHTLHCGPNGLYLSCLGGAHGAEGPGGVALLDHDNFDVLGAWETDRGPQYLAYDLWWHLNRNTMITSEWGTPSMIDHGIDPEALLGRQYGHALHFWDLAAGRHVQRLDLGEANQMVLELRPAHSPDQTWGFAGVVINVEDLSASVWLWDHDGQQWTASKVITIPAEPTDPAHLPPLLKDFGAVPPLVTDINLSVDDHWLYVSCWGTGELRQYDVSDPHHPRHTSSVHLGGIARHATHPSMPESPLSGGVQMVEVSRDGRRIYLTNSLYGSWDDQLHPDGVGAWMAKIDADAGGMRLDERFFPNGDDFAGLRVHQVRLEGGDASSDSYCFTEA